MFPASRGAWYLLTLGVLIVCGAVPVVAARETFGPVGFAVATIATIAVLFLLFQDLRDKRLEEEAENRVRAENARARPLESLAGAIERTTESLRRWSLGLGFAAILAVAWSLLSPATGAASNAVEAGLSALIWTALALIAWRVANTASRGWSLVLVAIPATDLVALVSDRVSSGGYYLVPLLFLALAGRCTWLTYDYHRRLRPGVRRRPGAAS